MPMIPEDDLEKLKRSVDLAAVIRSRGVERQRMQWFGTDADYRKTLPRLDPSPLAVLR